MNSVTEWSVEFDTMWNNIMSNQAPGLNAYEKSVFLTRAQEQLVKESFAANRNVFAEGFDDSRIRQADFSSLIESENMISVATPAHTFDNRTGTLHYRFPDGVFIPLNERVVSVGKEFVVEPISYDEYSRLMSKPFKYPVKGHAWRLIVTNDTTPSVDLVGRFPGAVTYTLRYVKHPEPIILENLTSGLSINGKTTAATCALPEHLHEDILIKAVNLAKIAWVDPTAPTQ